MKINHLNIGIKVFAVLFLFVAFLIKMAGLTDISMYEAIAVALAMVGFFFPIDASKIVEAIKHDA